MLPVVIPTSAPVNCIFSQLFGVDDGSLELVFAPENTSHELQLVESVVVPFIETSPDNDAQDGQLELPVVTKLTFVSPDVPIPDISLPELVAKPPENALSVVTISTPSPVVRVCS